MAKKNHINAVITETVDIILTLAMHFHRNTNVTAENRENKSALISSLTLIEY